MEIIIGKNTKVDLQKTLAVAVNVTAVSQLAEGVVTTSAAHGYANGDWVVISMTSGMIELDGQLARVKGAAASAFTLDGIDTTGLTLGTVSVGTVRKITAWEGFDNCKEVDIAEADPDRIDSSTIHSIRKTTSFGQDGELTGRIMVHSNPNQSAVALVRAATKNQSRMALRVTTGAGKIIGCNAEWAGGRGFNVSTGQISSSTINFTVIADTVFYAA